MSYYVQDKKGAGMLRCLEGKDRGVVHIDRTKALDFMVTELIADRFKYYMAAERLTEYLKHIEVVARFVEKNAQGYDIARWVEEDGKPDHYFHAQLYFHVALEKVFSGAGCGVVETEPLPGQGSKQPDKLDNTPRSEHIWQRLDPRTTLCRSR